MHSKNDPEMWTLPSNAQNLWYPLSDPVWTCSHCGASACVRTWSSYLNQLVYAHVHTLILSVRNTAHGQEDNLYLLPIVCVHVQ